MGNEAIHAGHCSAFRCVYADSACPVVEVEPGENRAERALAVLREPVDTALTIEFAVRDRLRNWVYALPRTLPKALKDQRGSRATAEWQLEKLAGTNPEDRQWFEIVQRPVGPWQEVSD